MTQSYGGPVSHEQVLTLPTPLLAIELLRALVASSPDMVAFDGLFNNRYYMDDRNSQQLRNRLADAWTWLESRGFIGVNPSQSYKASYRRITDVGLEIAQDDHALTKLWAGERLAGEFDEALASALTNFYFGDYQTACFAAMKAVEVAVRDAAAIDNSVTGVNVMRQAFSPKGGPLADSTAEGGEQSAVMELFAGAIGAFKNPNSHRAVDYDDPVEAAEIVQLADLLLRMLRRAEARSLRTDVESG